MIESKYALSSLSPLSPLIPQPLLSFPPFLLSHLQWHLSLPPSANTLLSVSQYALYHPLLALEPLIHNPSKIVSFVKDYYTQAGDPVWTVVPLFLTTMIGSYFMGQVTGNISQIGEWARLALSLQ